MGTVEFYKLPQWVKYAALAAAASLLFFPMLGRVHLFDWDEVNFAECAREMIVSKDYLRAQIDFMPFWEKPPFFIWMQVLSMKMFGIGEFAARFPNACVGVFTVCFVYNAGKKVATERVGFWWAVLFACTWLPHLYFKSGIIDPAFNLFIFMAFYQLYLLNINNNKWIHAALAGLFLGVAVLTKGPVAILVLVLSLLTLLVIKKGKTTYKIKNFLVITLFTLLPFGIWVLLATLKHGTEYGKWFLTEFLSYQVRLFRTEDSDHGGPFIYHFVVLLFGCFPTSVFLFQFMGRKKEAATPKSGFTIRMWILFWVVLILFSIVRTKIVHYSSLCYFPLTFLGATAINRLLTGEDTLRSWVKILLLFTGTVMAGLIIAIPIVGLNKELLYPLIDDPFAVGNLHADVSWHYWECIPGVFYFLAVIAGIVVLQKKRARGLAIIYGVQLITIQIALYQFVPKIEGYTQRAAIVFYRQFAGRDVYLHPIGFKSYAHLFYSNKQPFAAPQYYLLNRKDKDSNAMQPAADEQWLLYGATDKPTYFISKIQDTANYAHIPGLQEFENKNGFVFYLRKQ